MSIQDTILIVEDQVNLRDGWAEVLTQAGFIVVTASDGAEALQRMATIMPDLIISDVAMPVMNGYEFYRAVRDHSEWITIPFIFLTSRAEPEDFLVGRNLGADDYLTKPISHEELITAIRSRLGRFRQIKLSQIQQSFQTSMTVLANAIELRDPTQSGHIERMTEVCLALAAILGWHERRLNALRFGAIVHDIGKIQIPASILFKVEPLDDAEWKFIRRHTQIGAEMVHGVDMLEDSAAIILHHHEHWNGKGYPDGLAGKDIPEGARVVAVADALDAITSDRPYRAARSLREAYEEIMDQAGAQFDPTVALALKQAWEDGKIESIYQKYS